MCRCISILFVLFLPIVAFSQIPEFIPHTITAEAGGASSVYASDVDGDGDMDVLSASANAHRVVWYENDGEGIFTPHIITSTALGARSVFAEDVDSDGDMDILSASAENSSITWYENDGNEVFFSRTITTNADSASSVYALDLDGDGDIDVLSSSARDHKITWYENDGSETFTTRSITENAENARSVYATDLDRDGDIDVLSASAGDDKIVWYENDGNQIFTTHTITSNADGASSVYAQDIDGDMDIDVLSASSSDDKIVWYENNGSQGFTTHTITQNADGAASVYAIDVEGDGDMDILSASAEDDKIVWYENDGTEKFTPRTVTTTADGARSVFAIDMDGDRDIDILSASELDDRIAWYENDGLTPRPPLLSSPMNRAVVVADTAVLIWHDSYPNVDLYWIEGARDSLFSNPFIDSTLTDTMHTVAPVDQDETYWWKVKAHNEFGWGEFSEVRSFFVYMEIPVPPEPLSPDSGAVGVSTNPTLGWRPSAGSEFYTLQVSDADDFSNLIVDQDSIAAILFNVDGLFQSRKYFWRVRGSNPLGDSDWSVVWYFTTLVTDVGIETELPTEFTLSQNYPNPFNSISNFGFRLPAGRAGISDVSDVSLTIYDLLGQEIATIVSERLPPGSYTRQWDAAGLPGGVYFYRMQAGEFVETKKLLLLK